MPALPNRPCKHPGCRSLATKRDSYCKKHREAWMERVAEYRGKYNRKRGSSSKRGYNANWQKLRRIKLNSNPMCERCQVQAATVVHHVDHDSHNNRMSNLMSVCRSCHEIIHGRKREGGSDLWRLTA